jgi:hypothetical protein
LKSVFWLSKRLTCKISDKVNRGKPRKKYVVFHVAVDLIAKYIWPYEILEPQNLSDFLLFGWLKGLSQELGLLVGDQQ